MRMPGYRVTDRERVGRKWALWMEFRGCFCESL